MKKLYSFFVVLCFCANIFAQHDFTAANTLNGIGSKTIYYRITSSEEPLTVAVTYRSGSTATNNYTTYIVIPATVTNGTGVNMKTYQVTSVDVSAFSGQTTLDTVVLPSSVTLIDSLAFLNCTRLAKCVLSPNINFIGAKAFSGCSALRGITLPDNIAKISNGTFDNCRALTSVNIPSSVTSIGERAFANCIALESASMSNPDIPAATSIGNYAFSNCISLESINISSAVAKVSPTTFLGCLNLNSINVDDNNQVLMSDGGVLYSSSQDTLFFYPVKKTGTIFNAPNNLKFVSDYSFAYNLYLKNINFNNLLTKIGNSAFYNCTGLFSVNMYGSVSYIGENAFYNCRNLSSIKITATTPPEIQDFTFYNVPKSTPVIVSCYFLEDYQNSKWGEYFTNIQANFPYSVNIQGNINFTGNVSLIQAPTCQNYNAIIRATENRCYRFVKWSDNNTENPRNIIITQDTTFTAEFEPINYTLTVQSNNDSFGQTVIIQEPVCENNYWATIQATENNCYRFVRWSDNNTEKLRTVIITQDTTFTAEFELIGYTVTVQSNDDSFGQAVITQEPTCENNYLAIIKATANNGYDFVSWEDGNTDNPRNVNIISDSTFTANFESSVGIENLYDFDLKIFPNPVTSELRVKSEKLKINSVEILDITGKKLDTHYSLLDTHYLILDTNSLPQGVYLVKIYTDKGVKVERIIKN